MIIRALTQVVDTWITMTVITTAAALFSPFFWTLP